MGFESFGGPDGGFKGRKGFEGLKSLESLKSPFLFLPQLAASVQPSRGFQIRGQVRRPKTTEIKKYFFILKISLTFIIHLILLID